MSSGEAAVLTGRLLFRKGGASAAGFSPPTRIGDGSGVIEFAEKRKTPSEPAPTLRLSFKIDRARHQSLRIAAAKLGLTNSALITEALDHYLRSALPSAVLQSCACIAEAFGSTVDVPPAESR
ncbi:MAG TPA: hypothetical protein VMG55_00760 [Stellaceae bacterium]|nr:hypothetical protein [Stellaceae bacterium]